MKRQTDASYIKTRKDFNMLRNFLDAIWTEHNASLVTFDGSMFSDDDKEELTKHHYVLKHWDTGLCEPFDSVNAIKEKYGKLLKTPSIILTFKTGIEINLKSIRRYDEDRFTVQYDCDDDKEYKIYLDDVKGINLKGV